MLAPFLPQHLAALGLSERWSGIIFAFYPIAVILTTPTMNALCAKYGRLPLIGLGLIAQGLSAICFGFLNTNLTVLLLSRFTQGCGASACNLAMFALVTDLYEESLGFVSGLNELFIGFGFSAGPLIGAVLFDAGGFPMPFLVCGAILVGLSISTPLLKGQDASQENSAKLLASASGGDDTALQRLWAFSTRQLLVPAGLMLMGTILWGVIDSGFYTEHAADDLHMPQKGIGINLAAASLAYALIGPVAGIAADSIGYGSTMFLGGITGAFSLLLLGPMSPFTFGSFAAHSASEQQQQQWYEFAVLLILGAGQAAALIPTLGAMKCSVPAGNAVATEACISLFNAFQQAGLVIGPLASAALGARFSLGSAAMAVALLTYCVFFGRQLCRTGLSKSGEKGERLLGSSPGKYFSPSLEHGSPRSMSRSQSMGASGAAP